MIIASIPHNGARLTVEVIDVFTYRGRKMATVKALNGRRPFVHWSHGGWSACDWLNVPAGVLADVALSADLPATIPQPEPAFLQES